MDRKIYSLDYLTAAIIRILELGGEPDTIACDPKCAAIMEFKDGARVNLAGRMFDIVVTPYVPDGWTIYRNDKNKPEAEDE